MARSRRKIHIIFAAVAFLVAGVVAGGTYVAQADTNKSTHRLVAYDNNMENLVGCNGNNYEHLIHYIKSQKKSPDIITIQQISGAKRLKQLTDELTTKLPGKYAGVIALKTPGSMGYTDGCKVKKNHQTNAVIYRTGRLTAQKSVRWRSDAPKDPRHGTGPCRNLKPTSTSQDRVVNVGVRFWDKIAHKHVSVASIHWPTKKWNGPSCADENMREAAHALNGLGGSLEIFGGDANATTPQKNWWNHAVGYGFHDPIAEKCGHRVCSDRYNTTKKRRIDHILVKSGHGFSHVENITSGMAGGKYSNHRSVTAYVKY